MSDLQTIGASAFDSITQMVERLDPDFWERLEELRDMEDRAPEDEAELARMEAIREHCDNEDDARDAILEDALSVEVRSDWHTPGDPSEAAEYCILLSTGGPAVRIIGDLDQWKQPTSATLQVQNWGTPWTDYREHVADEDTLLQYVGCFYFGE